ncbi:MAG TPA: cytochrome c biogenesis protein CcsA, partial [bacterium]|nr:cytochrome c biogenesis protein CcsA [bacterium]
NPSAVIDVIQQYGQAFRQQNPHYLVELTYHRLHLLHMALLAAMVALVLGFVLKNPHHPMTVSVLSLLFFLQAAMVVFRVLIAGRAPVTNMYETVLWVGLGALVFGGLLGWWRRERLFLLFGVLINLVSLFMMMFADRMLDPTLKPLAPVLRDNFWLATHVTTITISYAAFGLSWLIANYYMIKGIASKIGYEEGKHLNEMTYDCLRIGVVLLSAGILLGAVWADYSWGRFWGWDPKETWSLVALMAYLAVLHGRYAGWIGDESFLPYVALAFLTIVIAWFGVNYVLASGLHSYGFSRGGATAILALIMAQIILFLLWKIRKIF